jgi:LDH2 family malate/lactate/ureidoglycolate dehydrogenase
MSEAVYKLNLPPDEDFVRVSHGDMQGFVASVARASGLVTDKADLLAELLTGNDLRGVFSHGTRQIARYARTMRDGDLNVNPEVKVIQEGPTSVVMDGDGGLGYFPMHEGTLRAIEKAKDLGVAVLQTKNHGHIGAAGTYARMTVEHMMGAFVTAGGELKLKPGQPVYTPAIGSPVAISAPAGREPPIVVDCAPVYDLRISPRWPELAEWIPGTIFRCIGLGMIAQSWGGIMAGTSYSAGREHPRRYRATGQCGFAFMFQVGLFIDPDEYGRDMDALAAQLRELAPLEGFERASYAGGIEGEREVEFRKQGIPVGPVHRRDLEDAAAEFVVDVPW